MNNNFSNLGIDEETRQQWLKDGNMTQQFLDDPKLDSKMAKAKNDSEKVKILYNYIHRHTKYPAFVSKKYIAEHKFQRTAEEIWKDKKMTGCTDYALVFSTLARKYGLPTTILDTVEQGCYEGIKNGEKLNGINGHAFCEVLVDGKWVLADPTFKITEKSYDSQNVKLTGLHNVLGKKKFVPYARVIDTQKKQNIQEHNQEMGETIKGERNEVIEGKPEIVFVTKGEIAHEGYYDNEKQPIITQGNKTREQGKEITQNNQLGE